MTKQELYALGIQAVTEFLELNGITIPEFVTYEEAGQEAFAKNLPTYTYFRRITSMDKRVVGAATGLYHNSHVFVNLPLTAAPVQVPRMRSWSWPGWKTDRTAMGVVAHETGHHVEAAWWGEGKRGHAETGAKWRELLRRHRRQVSGYEPVPSEAWAETVRLFILNPDLLRRALPERYGFVLGCGIRPVARLLKKGWKWVLGNENYFAAGERWIAGAR